MKNVVLLLLCAAFFTIVTTIAYSTNKRAKDAAADCAKTPGGVVVIFSGKKVCARIEILDEHKGVDHGY